VGDNTIDGCSEGLVHNHLANSNALTDNAVSSCRSGIEVYNGADGDVLSNNTIANCPVFGLPVGALAKTGEFRRIADFLGVMRFKAWRRVFSPNSHEFGYAFRRPAKLPPVRT
jgi:parallel beta-helix repeat protein